MGIIFDIQRCCYHDGPGIRTTVFLKGCNLRCAWCHNPESFSLEPQLQYKPEKCILGKEMSAEEVMKIVLQDTAYYKSSGGGVTFSGGEPTMQPVFLKVLLSLSKEHDLHTCIETNGYIPEALLKEIMPLTDLFLMDYKATDPAVLKQYTGAEGPLMLNALSCLNEAGKPVILRMPIIPGINDNPEHFEAAKALKNNFPAIQQIEIMPYHTLGADKWSRIGLSYTLSDIPDATQGQAADWRSRVSD